MDEVSYYEQWQNCECLRPIAYNKVLKVVVTSLVGADIIGVNCRFDHNLSLQTIGLMKEALDKEGLTIHLMMQPVGYLTPDAGPMGLAALPEAPLGKVYKWALLLVEKACFMRI